MYGKAIGKKFYEDGSIRRYPGNTVVADVVPGMVAYDVMLHLKQMVIDAGFDKDIILMPADSYHMTVFRGLNDQVRTDTHWPAALPKDLPFEKVDDYVSEAIAKAVIPEPTRMKFDEVRFSDMCVLVRLKPADEEQNRILREFRERAADAVGLRLPGHDGYHFHITLAYTRIVPEGEREKEKDALVAKMNEYISNQPEFFTTKAYMAYYDDMLRFSPERLPR